MKKVLTLIVAAILCMSASAQVQFGGKVGFDLTYFWGKDADHGIKPSYQFGLIMEYKATPNFAIAPEVVFAAQGSRFKALEIDFFDMDVSTGTVTCNTNYINVPIMFKYYVAPSFSIDLGPQVGFNVYSKYSVKGVDKAVDIKDGTKPVDVGVGIGGTYNLTDNAFVQARYTMGLTKVYKADYNKEKNGNIQIAFGMKF